MVKIDSKIKYAEGKISFFLTKLKRYWITVLIISIICGTLGGVATVITYSPTYTVTQAFTIELKDNPNANQSTIKDSQLSKTVPALLSSEPFIKYMAPIIHNEGLEGKFKVSSLSNTNIFYITVESSSNKSGIRIIELIQDNYSGLADMVIGEGKMIMMATPSTSNLPSNSPHYAKNTAICFFVGLIIALAMLILQTFATKTFTDEHDAQKLLNSECLAVIDEIKEKRRTKGTNKKQRIPLVTSDDANLEFKQSINKLATKVLASQRDNGIKVIMLTSTISGEGKTSICTNLACNLAEIGKKVLIIDCDLRAPNVHFHIGANESKDNLSNAIKNPLNASDYIVKSEIENLSLLMNTEADGKAFDIANGKNTKAIIDSIKDDYDFILIDTPPVGFLGDGISISDSTDGFIYVISHNYINTSYVLRSLEAFNGSNSKMLGFVINHKQ